MKLSRQNRARLAWAASFFKRRWRFEDYPLDYIDQGQTFRDLPPRLQHKRWRVDLVNWFAVSGVGDTQEAALADAIQKFAAHEASGEKMWRPGTGPGIVFASNESVNLYPDLQHHFINRVLGLPWAFLSDQSSLWDFHEEPDNSAINLKIGEIYGVDVAQIEDGNIAKILSKIMDEIRDFPEDPINRAIRLGRDPRSRHLTD
jgi:hypothetical protein